MGYVTYFCYTEWNHAVPLFLIIFIIGMGKSSNVAVKALIKLIVYIRLSGFMCNNVINFITALSS